MKSSVVKMLYGISGGKCALCKTNIVLSMSDGSTYHISEIAHIQGRGRKALRHDPTMSQEEIDDISNLIILCTNCHTIIDKNEIDYPVEEILRIKSEHEEWVRSMLIEDSGTDPDFKYPFSIRRKYLDLISDFIASREYLDSQNLLSIIKREGVSEFVESFDSKHLPSILTILDHLVLFALRKEQAEQTGVWRERLIRILNRLLLGDTSSEIWRKTIDRIPPRELEKAGISYSQSKGLFKSVRPRCNDGDSDPLFNNTDITWFSELLDESTYLNDILECSILSGLNTQKAKIVSEIVKRAVVTHQANRLLQTLGCTHQRRRMDKQLQFAIQILKEAIEDWGDRIQAVELKVEPVLSTDSNLQVDVLDCTHIEESDGTLHHIDLSFRNRSVTTMRVSNISFYDSQGNELDYASRGQTSPPETQFALRGKDTYPWSCYCTMKKESKQEEITLKMVIETRGLGDTTMNLVSVKVPEKDLPCGDFSGVLDMG
jgi:hypothetical protein